ncbi:MAG: hypothetical protein A3B91_04320 [Candidatus Yanofskybacteria bacterium RIFCSPHIGHO2_02_FULL_41_29]|uniref:NadR/Ttd14 AAA domain-containing protein n=1 Tax=Candidatus Yanofskybacteria bacterium RIFCSPHIGHO2_01_FULL_41_53 TaxID=1802663 RepID=A0A1F8EHY4_9BACT|nr:MAG: hypothetical protein A2650_03580 [Candidatus Yanofskybacteria bacterium RIFCSPHIGHO2_01_FULL_41_53]OGN11748.1 MAG: hypothetical protein A3B91_04320 [Candidatus Yanofskybacteria bacterium RIFCSPHIGHO2_02_FULL_41_29]OGN17513.1 MAG: hypothetical protein A3F48_01880 [Candidatus Yanofskybacteria bacterium RIFCSPHIGHO2_12_FULL_41_9]OGN22902.1 MAG: hypothetical protein A2916_00775 [Candidatus Yanofskybacteria bacterium RIFCSPLOWO2_01_FULL_41_67]OGN30284.1 MAG: hypothetical protein A3H54_05175 
MEPVQIDEKVLTGQVKVIKSFLKTDLRHNLALVPRPFIIELTGSPGSGKSLTTQVLYDYFRIKGLRVLIPQEAAEVIQHISRTTPLYNIRTGLESLTKIIDESSRHNYDIIIFNRAIFDAYCWAQYWFEKGKLSSPDQSNLKTFFINSFFTSLIDRAYIFVCEAEKAMAREFRVTISKQGRETTNPNSIANLVKIFRDSYSYLHLFHRQLQFIDTTNMTEQEMVDTVAEDLINALAKLKIKSP